MRGSEIVRVNEKDHHVRCYDLPAFGDRYTVVYMDQPRERNRSYQCVAMSEAPYDPRGLGYHCTAILGPHLGRRIPFETLPANCQWFVKDDLEQ